MVMCTFHERDTDLLQEMKCSEIVVFVEVLGGNASMGFIFPFDWHKGKDLSEVPDSYLQWIV